MSGINTAVTLKDLPPPPAAKRGWPWTEQSDILADRMPNGNEWPQISIVTPNYNYGRFIEETIRSVLLQGYPNLEYIIIDGGSTDNSVEIIKKYQPWLSYWKSEKDQGQSDAINRGFLVSTGVIMGWVNSDDMLAPGAFKQLAMNYKPGLNWWNSPAAQILPDGSFVSTIYKNLTKITERDLLHARLIIPQISTFWNREMWVKSGSYISNLNLAMDYELWLRFSKYSAAKPIYYNLGIYRNHNHQKTANGKGFNLYLSECDMVRKKEYEQRGYNLYFRKFLINFWTRIALTKRFGWRSLFGRRQIPYI